MNNQSNEQINSFEKFLQNIPWKSIDEQVAKQVTKEYGNAPLFTDCQSRYIHLLIQNACVEIIGSYNSWLLNHLDNSNP